MDLFEELEQQPVNRLPKDGEVLYYGVVFSGLESLDIYRELLQSIDWTHDEAIVMGKKILTARKVAWHAEQAYEYTYSKVGKIAKPWTSLLRELKDKAECVSGERYNACLLNLYHQGSEGMAWHSDSESQLKQNGAIASFSFGAERSFLFKHKVSQEKISIILESGSLLVMKGETQSHWLHRLPPSVNVVSPRINLTFRCMV